MCFVRYGWSKIFVSGGSECLAFLVSRSLHLFMSGGGVYGCTDAAAGHVEEWGCCNVLEVLVGGEDTSRRRSYRGCQKIVDAR